MASHKIDRINADAQKELAVIVRTLKDPRIPLMTSVMSVRVTEDLKFAKVYVSVMGDDEVKKNCIKALENAAGYCRKELAKAMDLRNTPQLIFTLDDSIEYGAKINRILKDLVPGEENE